MTTSRLFQKELIDKYNLSGPRYTSYPSAMEFSHIAILGAYSRRTSESLNPLSLYMHIPFCRRLCFYCGCNKVVTKRQEKANPYVSTLIKEIAMQAKVCNAEDRVVKQMHWGGGTPNFLPLSQMRKLMEAVHTHFNVAPESEREFSIEIDPQQLQPGDLSAIRALGFNRVSFGIQDVDPVVQYAVNRRWPSENMAQFIAELALKQFDSVGFDLIYGLPNQSVVTFEKTLDTVLGWDPDRLSIFNYAHMPHLFMPQRRINESELPAPEEKLAILQMAIGKIEAQGYRYIGMDHFAKPTDELAIAQENGTLYRNFQGYSTHADCDLIGMGATSISQIGDLYTQNHKDLDEYYAAINNGKLAVTKGIALTRDDEIRRSVIMKLICDFMLDLREIERKYRIVFAEYFAAELEELACMQSDGLLSIVEKTLHVNDSGRLLIRNICMVFDQYLKSGRHANRFSKAI